MAIPHGALKFALAGFTPAPALAVDKQSIKFDESANTNLHELHNCKVGGGLPNAWALKIHCYSKLWLKVYIGNCFCLVT